MGSIKGDRLSGQVPRERKLLEGLKQNLNAVPVRKAVSLLKRLGATRRKKGGSDHVFTHPLVDWPLTVPSHSLKGTLKPYAGREVVQFIEEILDVKEAEGGSREQEG